MRHDHRAKHVSLIGHESRPERQGQITGRTSARASVCHRRCEAHRARAACGVFDRTIFITFCRPEMIVGSWKD